MSTKCHTKSGRKLKTQAHHKKILQVSALFSSPDKTYKSQHAHMHKGSS
jgi:hypothetical protein